MQQTKIALLAGGMGVRMKRLGHRRLKPLVPFGGSCHLIDFSIHNARKSGAQELLLMAQYNERQLVAYLLQSWCQESGFRIHFGPYQGVAPHNIDETFARIKRPVERGTADALIANAPYLFDGQTKDVMVLHADHVYQFDYQPMIDQHRKSGAALTVGFQEIAPEFVPLFGMVDFDDAGNLTQFVEKPAVPTSNNVFSAVCIFDADVLQHYLEKLAGGEWQHDISRDVIPAMLAGGETIKGFRFDDYWEDIGTVERYFRANLRMLGDTPSMPRSGMPRTLGTPRYVDHEERLRNSLVPPTLDTRAVIEDAIVYPGARIGHGAVVRNSIIFPGAVVPDGVVIDHAMVLEPQRPGKLSSIDILQMEPQA
jgi:glucose-1-phosphate adenylyltransferase